MGNWLLPWRERGRSGPTHDSLLWQHGRLYVMDNHRLALWCWWQHLDEASRWSYHHVDRHFDALWEKENPWSKHTTAQHRTDLNSFRSARFRTDKGREEFELYRWDTITSALLSLHGSQIGDITFASANEGDRPSVKKAMDIAPWKLPSHLRYLADPDESPLVSHIIDIDIDYFTHQDLDGPFGQVFSDDYIRELGESIRCGLENDRFGVVTVALSPTTTGSWELAERLTVTLLNPLGLDREFLAGAP